MPWSVENPLWQGVLMSGAKMKSGRTARRLAGDLIAYLVAGRRWARKDRERLVKDIRKNLPDPEAKRYQLPPPMADPWAEENLDD